MRIGLGSNPRKCGIHGAGAEEVAAVRVARVLRIRHMRLSGTYACTPLGDLAHLKPKVRRKAEELPSMACAYGGHPGDSPVVCADDVLAPACACLAQCPNAAPRTHGVVRCSGATRTRRSSIYGVVRCGSLRCLRTSQRSQTGHARSRQGDKHALLPLVHDTRLRLPMRLGGLSLGLTNPPKHVTHLAFA